MLFVECTQYQLVMVLFSVITEPRFKSPQSQLQYTVAVRNWILHHAFKVQSHKVQNKGGLSVDLTWNPERLTAQCPVPTLLPTATANWNLFEP